MEYILGSPEINLKDAMYKDLSDEGLMATELVIAVVASVAVASIGGGVGVVMNIGDIQSGLEILGNLRGGKPLAYVMDHNQQVIAQGVKGKTQVEEMQRTLMKIYGTEFKSNFNDIYPQTPLNWQVIPFVKPINFWERIEEKFAATLALREYYTEILSTDMKDPAKVEEASAKWDKVRGILAPKRSLKPPSTVITGNTSAETNVFKWESAGVLFCSGLCLCMLLGLLLLLFISMFDDGDDDDDGEWDDYE